jgi:hypothetical protein
MQARGFKSGIVSNLQLTEPIRFDFINLIAGANAIKRF